MFFIMSFGDGTCTPTVIFKEKVYNFIATKWDMHDVSSTPTYMIVLCFNLQTVKFLVVLLTFTKMRLQTENGRN